MSSLRLSGLAVLAVAALLAATASSALAARGHVFKEAFGTPCAELVCLPGELKEPSAVAVNEATGEVYVLDQGNSRIEVFDGETGAFIRQFDGSATPASSFEFGAAPQVSGIAVDNSCSLEGLVGAACVDPSNEDVYVVDAGHNVVDKFTAEGGYLGQITAAGGDPFELLLGVSTDVQGLVWVHQKGGAVEPGKIDQFANPATNEFLGALEPFNGASGFFAPGFAVDGGGYFYLRGRANTPSFIEKYDHAGHLLKARLDEEDSSAVAADLSTSNAFVDNLTTVAAFAPDGAELERLGEEGGAHHLTAGAGLVADAKSEDLYVADRAADRVVVFEAQQPSTPEIVSEGVLDISSAAATIEAEVNPRGAETTYKFEYGACSGGVLTCLSSPFPSTTPLGALPADFEIHRVTDGVGGLQPNIVYHYRVSAANSQSAGPTIGPAKTFVTQFAGAPLTLPDFRAWELVSPADKQGASIEPIEETGVVQAADDGEAITYLANAATEPQPQGTGVSGAVQILSTRGADGWVSQDIATPHLTATGVPVGPGKEYRAFSENLAFAFVNPFGAFEPAISPQATEGTAFRRADYLNDDPAQQCIAKTKDCYQPLVTAAAGVADVPAGTLFGRNCVSTNGNPCGPLFQDATPDGGDVILQSNVALTAASLPSGGGLYEWSADAPPSEALQMVSLLPESEGELPVKEPVLGLKNLSFRNALSDDGSRVVFSEGGLEGNNPIRRLFLRDIAKGETVQLDAAEPQCLAELKCESGGGRFQLASADGSRVLFLDDHRLTADSGAKFQASSDLYECRIVENSAGEDECDLTDLTPESGGETARVLGSVIGGSEDGSWAYFVANGVLPTAPDSQGGLPESGTCSVAAPAGATCNLYAVHDGQVQLVSVISNGDQHIWSEATLRELPARVSPDGRWLAFMSERRLTGYDNRDVATRNPTAEVYLYDAASYRLVCASCDPTGARPRGVEYHPLEPGSGGLVGGPRATWEPNALVAANLPGWTGNEVLGKATRHQPRYLSDTGRLFFNTVNALVPQDSNGTQDVYEYEPPGVGSCTSSSPTYGELSGGCVGLISSGTSAQESAFLDASESGNDVFFLTSSRLAPKDIDTARDVYDARVGGGEAEVTASLPCSGDACQTTTAPPGESNPGSLEFQGPGNEVQCRKGQVKKGGKCVKKSQPKKHKKKHGKNKKGKGKNHHAKSKRGSGK